MTECFKFILFQITENSSKIKENNLKIKDVSISKKEKTYILNTINTLHQQNVLLIKENTRLIDFYGTVSKFYNEYHVDIRHFLAAHIANFSNEKLFELTELKELFMEKTMNEEFPFNELHPFYHDDYFIKQLAAMY